MAGSAGAPDAGSGGVSGSAGSGPSAGAGMDGGAGSGGGLRFLDASPVAELDTEDIEDNPTLTADGLQIFFTSDRGGDMDVWVATRQSSLELFGEPELVAEASTDDVETSPAITLDGLTLFVGQRDQGGGVGLYDVWALERPSRTAAWSDKVNVTELNSAEDDTPRPPAMNDTVMPLASRRSMEGYRTYLATRASSGDPFGEPMLIEELTVAGRSTVDGFLTEDGLMLFYSSAAEEDRGDLYYATRESDDEPFGPPTAIFDLNTAADERDPWLSPDGTTLYFATNREGTHDIFVASVTRE
jgi:Tol biopolymer transport system component